MSHILDKKDKLRAAVLQDSRLTQYCPDYHCKVNSILVKAKNPY